MLKQIFLIPELSDIRPNTAWNWCQCMVQHNAIIQRENGKVASAPNFAYLRKSETIFYKMMWSEAVIMKNVHL